MRDSQRWSVTAATLLVVGIGSIPPTAAHAAEDTPRWKAGAAAIKITPEKMTWMAGYAARTKPAEGVAQDLYAKALVIEDNEARRLVIVTFDLVGISRAFRDALARDIEAAYHVSPQALLLNASHTHCGPEVKGVDEALTGDESERVRLRREYVEQLKSKVVQVVGQAVARLEPARLDYLHARAGFAMNRRRPTPKGYTNASNAEGPVDHEVPVLRVTGSDGKTLKAVLFGYACHNTTLAFYQFCGDYAGFAQQYLEESHPGTVALFMTGCGGDQNPYPRGTIELCRQHGRSLATAVDAALDTVPRPLAGPLNTAWQEVELEFAPPPGRDELVKLESSSNQYEKRHATLLLKQLEKDGRIRTTYPYPIQVIHFGRDLTLVALAGETVVDYSLRFKRELPGPVWVAGYCNDVFGYVPSRRVLEEGGYEAGGAMLYTAFPGPFAPSVEERISRKVLEMAGKRPGN